VEPPSEAPAEPPGEARVELTYEQPYEPPAETRIEPPTETPPPSAVEVPLHAPDPAAPEEPIAQVEAPPEPPNPPVATLRLVPPAPAQALHPAQGVDPLPTTAPPPAEPQAEFLRLFEVVTRMCDHVIDYIEADRAERRLMIETLSQLARVITDGAAATVAANASGPALLAPPAATPPAESRERLIGGSMPAGPDPVIDLRQTEPRPAARPRVQTDTETVLSDTASTEIAVEVRGRFGDRWVDGFEICEVTTTPDGPRYRLRRQRDGVVLPELFDATSIRHIETFEQLSGDQLNDSSGHWSRS
jgi:hypothetical protein